MSMFSNEVAKISKPGARFHTRRTLRSGNSTAIKQHNARVGAVIHAYNSAHAALFMVLTSVARKDGHQAIREIWLSYGSDSGQRKFAEAYCRNNVNIKPPLRRAIVWSIRSLGELATLRNDAAHTDMVWYYDRLAPGVLARDGTYQRIEAAPFDGIWRQLQGDFSAISNYLWDLQWDVGHSTWPSSKRPRLALAKAQSALTQDQRRRAKQKARAPKTKAL